MSYLLPQKKIKDYLLSIKKEKLIITGISKDYSKQLEDIEQQKNIYARKKDKYMLP